MVYMAYFTHGIQAIILSQSSSSTKTDSSQRPQRAKKAFWK